MEALEGTRAAEPLRPPNPPGATEWRRRVFAQELHNGIKEVNRKLTRAMLQNFTSSKFC